MLSYIKNIINLGIQNIFLLFLNTNANLKERFKERNEFHKKVLNLIFD